MGKSGKILYDQTMQGAYVKTVYKLGEKFKTTIVIWANNKLYIHPLTQKAAAYSELSKTKPEPITDLEALIAQGVTKSFYDEVEAIRDYESGCPGRPPNGQLLYLPTVPQIFRSKVSKATLLARLSAYCSFSEEIIQSGTGLMITDD